MKKIIQSTKDVETFIFCKEVQAKKLKTDYYDEDLMSEEELDELQGGLKILNLEDDEDISHHNSVTNKYKDIYRDDEDEKFKN